MLQCVTYLTWAFLNHQSLGGGGEGHDVLLLLYTMIRETFVMSLLLCNYDIITCILSNA